jgi:hypothetical protein
MIDITGLNKAKVLAALWNASRMQGISFLGNNGSNHMTEEEANKILSDEEFEDKYFDYLNGRVMKVDLSGDELDPRLYDRDNGQGAAKRAIDSI